MEITDGTVHIVGDELAGLPVAEVAAAAYFDPSVRGSEPEPLLSSERFHDPAATYSNGCMVAVVEIDLETAGVEVIDLVAIEDCGRMIHPVIVEGQMRGAAVQGLGCALLEEVTYRDDGQLLTATLMDYLLPTSLDSPRVRIGHLESPSPNTVGGVKGMGESGMIAMPAAIANAIADVLPEHAAIERLPVTPDALADLFSSSPTSGKAPGRTAQPVPFP